MRVLRLLSGASAAAGRGLLAGLAGTAAMTVSSTLEARIRGRGGSSAPADAAAVALGVHPEGEGGGRFSTLVHWGYGTGWGAVRGLVGWAGLSGTPATAAHLAAVWGGEQVVLPATGTSGPATAWGVEEIAIDLLHHSVYAAATGVVYEALDRAGPA
ncbi:hypothetical protein [Nocardiopsis kunsanensis]|uniref:DUF1440 domain-containing protein n=1 Tax=Nocardiopsis kunsanensis TaxID=141693 RepID=A0A918XIR8_9ACTN|nr:hypothetical protein [Nocardiopsis kunsanensis]GHD32645.1 hypothetical protein GCM10007147_36460 [Nocardiopsis kunsanensis]